MNINTLVEKYVALRDKKATIKAEYDGKIERIEELLKKVEGVMLNHFEETGTESVRTAAGTCYRSTRSSCTVADREVFRAFILANNAWELADLRASKKAVEEYKTANEDLPPGLNYSAEVVVGVRRGK